MHLLKYFTAEQVLAIQHFIPFHSHFNMMVVEAESRQEQNIQLHVTTAIKIIIHC